MAKKVEITLKKDGSEDIIVKCPRKVKLSIGGALLAIRFGLPPADIKPVQGKDVIKCIVLFLLIFVAAALFVVPPLGVVALVVVLFLNIRYNQNYFVNFIKQKLSDGYTVEDSEQKQILQEAGISIESNGATASSSSTQSQSSQEDVSVQLEKLASLKEKGILSDEEFAAQKAKLLGL
ncbi:MAG: SHOCT domain-containing protein [Treponema sp.]|uniref:SHOCT domain-containing protein n=1 Tax=Treponema sp. TaxID=166 RepID=UPI0025ED36BA|nr:SHOCT domain-containing protein [Treponema sp.]MBQ8680766.1 SHOCT domain-containing protein [Treponema sp.]